MADVSAKVDLVVAFLATGIYRPWFWQHFKDADKQSELKADWMPVCERFSRREIMAGLRQWAHERGAGCPPEAQTFLEFVSPRLTNAGKQNLQQIRNILENGKY